MQASHTIWFFPYEANTIFSRLSIFEILLFSATTCTCWICDLNAGAVDRYDLKYKHLFIEVFQIEILATVKHSFSSLFVQTVLAPLYCIDWFTMRTSLGIHLALLSQFPFFAFYNNKEFLEHFPASQNILFFITDLDYLSNLI